MSLIGLAKVRGEVDILDSWPVATDQPMAGRDQVEAPTRPLFFAQRNPVEHRHHFIEGDFVVKIFPAPRNHEDKTGVLFPFVGWKLVEEDLDYRLGVSPQGEDEVIRPKPFGHLLGWRILQRKLIVWRRAFLLSPERFTSLAALEGASLTFVSSHRDLFGLLPSRPGENVT